MSVIRTTVHTAVRATVSTTWARSAAGVRRLVARRPWVQWLAIALVALAAAAAVHRRSVALDAERAAWGEGVRVWVAADDVGVGEVLVVEAATVPAPLRPRDAVTEVPAGTVARQEVVRGAIVTTVDVVSDADGLVPDGWLVVPIVEATPSGAAVGDRVVVASGGFVIADAAVVVGVVDTATLVATPEAVAPLLPAAAVADGVTLLRPP